MDAPGASKVGVRASGLEFLGILLVGLVDGAWVPAALNERLDVLGRHFPQAPLQRALLALNRGRLLRSSSGLVLGCLFGSSVEVAQPCAPLLGVHAP